MARTAESWLCSHDLVHTHSNDKKLGYCGLCGTYLVAEHFYELPFQVQDAVFKMIQKDAITDNEEIKELMNDAVNGWNVQMILGKELCG